MLTVEMPIANAYHARFVRMQYFPALFYENAVYHIVSRAEKSVAALDTQIISNCSVLIVLICARVDLVSGKWEVGE